MSNINDVIQWFQNLPAEVIHLCREMKAQPVILKGEEQVTFIVPKKPTYKMQALMDMVLPGFIKHQWRIGLKPVTADGLVSLITRSGGLIIGWKEDGRVFHISVTAPDLENLGEDSIIWGYIKGLLIADEYPEACYIKINDQLVFSWDKAIEHCLTEHRTDGLVISQDDITNVTIALGQCKSVDEFLATI